MPRRNRKGRYFVNRGDTLELSRAYKPELSKETSLDIGSGQALDIEADRGKEIEVKGPGPLSETNTELRDEKQTEGP